MKTKRIRTLVLLKSLIFLEILIPLRVQADSKSQATKFREMIELATQRKDQVSQGKIGLRNVTPKQVDPPHPVEFQRPDNFFENGIPPKNFVELATQRREWARYQDEILKRADEDKKRTDIFRVAILDVGFDLGNPEVIKRTEFTIEKGKIIGAGYDYRGADGWGSAVILDPWIYAIGATGINEVGQIQNQIDRPVAYLTALNDDLVLQLIKRIQNNSKLSNSFFTKLDRYNTSIMGLLRLSQFQLDSNSLSQLNSQGKQVYPSADPQALTQNPELKIVYDFANTAWAMDPSSGLPDFFSRVHLESLAGIDILIQEIKSLYNAENKKFVELMENVSQVNDYLKIHHFNVGAPRADVLTYTFSKLTEQIAFKKIGPVMADPAYSFLLELRAIKIKNPELTWNKIVTNSLNAYRKVFQGIALHADSKLSYNEMQRFVSGFQSADDVEKFLLERNRVYNMDVQVAGLNTTGKVPWVSGISSLMRKLSIRTSHLLYHPESIEADHATHIMATGTPYTVNYRAIPFAVNLGRTKAILPIQNEMVEKNINALRGWMQIPVVARALHKKLSEDVGLDLSKVDVNTTEGRRIVSEFMVELYQSELRASADVGGIVGQTLHWELADRVEKVAQEKILFANLSLGGIGEQPELRPTMNNSYKKLGAQLEFIFTEFQKYMIAEAIHKKAPNTMFFMAAGNSNNFGDGGKVRSNYPADLRSAWLEESSKRGDYLPAEQADNVIIGMSNNEKGVPSNFTNIVFTNKSVFSTRGEDIISETFTHNLTGAETTVKAEAPWISSARYLLLSLRPDDPRLEDVLKQLSFTPEQFAENKGVVLQALEAQSLHLKIQHNDHQRHMDGTSMATPGLLFTVMEQLAKQRANEFPQGILEADLYGRKGYRPQDVITFMQKTGVWKYIGKPSRKGNYIKYLDLQNNHKTAPRSQKHEELVRTLQNIKNSSILCPRFYENN